MSAVVVDTHTIIWYLVRDPRLSVTARAALNGAADTGELIFVPSICLVEMIYLVEKGRISATAELSVLSAVDDLKSPCQLVPLDRHVADAINRVSRKEVPDLPDRIIAATAISLELPLVTRDSRIRSSQIQSIW